MLVLTRKPREEIRIGNGITITVLRVKGQAVRIGIDAPDDVRIVRSELAESIAESPAIREHTASLPLVKPNGSNEPSEGTPRRYDASTRRSACPDRAQSMRSNVSTLRMLAARQRTRLLVNQTSPTKPVSE